MLIDGRHEIIASLAPRLLPVLRGVLEGKRNRVIADEAGVAVHTVENYLTELFAVLGCESRAELLAGLKDVDPNSLVA